MNDLSNKEKIIHTYMKELAKKEFPNVDLSDNGAFMEMFGIPHIKMLLPLLEFADRVKLTQSLDNAALMTEEEMDELAAKHFHYRKGGDYATGYAYLSYDDIPSNGVLQIPAGTEVESKQGYRFRSTETIILNEADLSNYYDPELFRYRIPVFLEAENRGTQYNIEENELVRVVTNLPHLSEVTNEISFAGGKDRETNLDLANRIKSTSGTPNLGVERGWINFARSFDDVEDVRVAGFGHPLMKRDIIGKVPAGRFSKNVEGNVHWGGKVDLHIRGERLIEGVDVVRPYRNAAGELVADLSMHPVRDIAEIEFSSPRYSDPDLDPSFFVVRDFMMMKDEDPETIGTLHEKAWVIINDDRLDETDTLSIRYRYNNLIQVMTDNLYTEDNRPPGSDVLLKEAKKKHVHTSMIISLESVIGIKEKDRSIIRQRLYNWLRELPTGAELQFSDMTEPVYQYEDDSLDTKVDYINLPSQFIVTDHDNRYLYYCLNQDKRNFLDEVRQSSVYFDEWIPYYMNNVTIYDFFDVMHLLTYQNVAKDAWKEVSFLNHEWGKKVHFINLAKRMLAYADGIQKLSLPKWKSEENEFYELGHFAIFEDVVYEKNNLQEYVQLLETIANPGETTKDDQRILHLVVYCALILYVITSETQGGRTVKDLFEWLVDLTKGTPIDYQVHH